MDVQSATQQVAAVVTAVVADHHRIGVRDLRGSDRRQVIVEARWMAIEITGRLTSASGVALAEAFGLDHTTVLHARRRLRQRLRERLDLAGSIDALERRCTRAVRCPALERCLRDQWAGTRDARVLDELARRLRSDWTVTIHELEQHLFGGARNAA